MTKLITEKSEITKIIIACCTYKRAKKLERLLNNLCELNYPNDIETEILIVDNDFEQSAKDVVEKFRNKLNINYVVEEEKGLSNVRNKALMEAIQLGASHIAFIDDDEIADINWLINHIKFYNKFEEIYISSGYTYKKFEYNYPNYILKNRIFKTPHAKKLGEHRETCATGNVFFPLNIVNENKIYFSNEFNKSGSEDTDFFSRINKSGFKIGWNCNAINYEIIGKERATINWILKRAFHIGFSVALRECKANPQIRGKYILSRSFTIIWDSFYSIVSIFLGITKFINAVTLLSKDIGKLFGALILKNNNYYQ